MTDWESIKDRLLHDDFGGDSTPPARQRQRWLDVHAALERVEGVEGAMRADDKRLEDAAIRVWGEHRWGCDTPEQMADLILELRQRVEELEREAEGDMRTTLVGIDEALRLQKRAEAAEAKLARVVEIRTKMLADTCPGEHEWEPNCDHGASHDLILAATKGE